MLLTGNGPGLNFNGQLQVVLLLLSMKIKYILFHIKPGRGAGCPGHVLVEADIIYIAGYGRSKYIH